MYGSKDEFSQFRVYLCGPFQLERRVGERFVPVGLSEWQGRTGSRTVLKALLGCPGRQARRDMLLALLWPDEDPQHVGAIVQKAVASVRHIFGSCFLEHGVRSNLYQLAPQEQVWVDVDAAQQLLATAEQRGRTSAQALPLLEEAAGYLTRGTFLEEEEGEWMRSRQETVERLRSRSQLWFAEALLAQGRVGQAEMVLTALWERDPFDEGVLRRLLALLCQQGMKRQALRLYAQAARLFEQEDLALSEETEQFVAQLKQANASSEEQALLPLREENAFLAGMELLEKRESSQEELEDQENDLQPDPHTQDVAEYLGAEPIQKTSHSPSVSFSHRQNRQGESQDLRPRAQVSSQRNMALNEHIPATRNSMVPNAAGEGPVMDQLRRQLLLHTLKGTGVAILAPHNSVFGSEIAERLTKTLIGPLGLVAPRSLLHNEELLSIYTTTLPIYWRLYFDGHLAEVSSLLPECLSHLLALASQPSRYQKQAANLVSKASQLACMLALQEQQFGNALLFARQGFAYGKLVEDPNLQVTSLVRKALVYFYLKKPIQKLQAYQEALQYEAAVADLVRARIYMGLSEAQSNLAALGEGEREQKARAFLELSYATLPRSPKEDPHFSYTHFGKPSGYESLLYLDLHQPQQAWDLLEAQSHTLPVTIMPDRVTLVLRQTRALIALGQKQEGCEYLETAITAARVLNSRLLVKEAYDVYQQLFARWPNERQVMELADLFLAEHNPLAF